MLPYHYTYINGTCDTHITDKFKKQDLRNVSRTDSLVDEAVAAEWLPTILNGLSEEITLQGVQGVWVPGFEHLPRNSTIA